MILATLLLMATAPAPAPAPAKTAPAACAAQPPAAFGPGPHAWIGNCRDGRADGPGVLRAQRGQVLRFFYGTYAAGRPVRGVLTNPRGDYIPAWSFNAALQPTDDPTGDRRSSIATFDAAAAGARTAAARYRAAGNAASASHYARKAAELENQLD